MSHAPADDLFAYTLTRGDAAFVHQHALDAWVAQTATPETPPQRLVFALVGLCLHVEQGRTGRDVQQAHARLARRGTPSGPSWPAVTLPESRGDVTVSDVLAAPAGDARDAAIRAWCVSVWQAYAASQPAIVAWLAASGFEQPQRGTKG
jgi:hypothetical protein